MVLTENHWQPLVGSSWQLERYLLNVFHPLCIIIEIHRHHRHIVAKVLQSLKATLSFWMVTKIMDIETVMNDVCAHCSSSQSVNILTLIMTTTILISITTIRWQAGSSLGSLHHSPSRQEGTPSLSWASFSGEFSSLYLRLHWWPVAISSVSAFQSLNNL